MSKYTAQSVLDRIKLLEGLISNYEDILKELKAEYEVLAEEDEVEKLSKKLESGEIVLAPSFIIGLDGRKKILEISLIPIEMSNHEDQHNSNKKFNCKHHGIQIISIRQGSVFSLECGCSYKLDDINGATILNSTGIKDI